MLLKAPLMVSSTHLDLNPQTYKDLRDLVRSTSILLMPARFTDNTQAFLLVPEPGRVHFCLRAFTLAVSLP